MAPRGVVGAAGWPDDRQTHRRHASPLHAAAGDVTARRSAWDVYGFPLVVVAASILTVIAVLRGRPGSSTTDFISFYQSGSQFLAGADPYVPFVAYRGPNLNPPWIVALMSQLCRLPLSEAVVIWWTFSFACFFVAIHLIARTVAPGHDVTIASVLLVTQAAYSNIRLGQVAWPVMLLLTAAWCADRLRRPVACGALLGLAISWKPFLVVFVPYVVWRREWTMLAAMGVAIAATVAAGVVVVGVASYRSWLTILRLVGWEGHVLNGSIAGFFSRALELPVAVASTADLLTTARLWLRVLWIASGLVAIALTAVTIRAARNRDVAWASLPLLAILLSPLGWVHYVLLGAGAIVAVLLSAPPSARALAVAGWLLVCNPLAWSLPTNESGRVMMLTMASSYTWGTLLLLSAVLVSGFQQRRRDIWSAADDDRRG